MFEFAGIKVEKEPKRKTTLRLYAPLKPENRLEMRTDAIILNGISAEVQQQFGENMKMLTDLDRGEFYFANDDGECVRFRGSDVLYISIKRVEAQE
jgi:hypothetical protein